MTEVLFVSQPDGDPHFGSSLSPSSSQSSLLLQHSSSYPRSNSNLQARYRTLGYDTKSPASALSSAPSSPQIAVPGFSREPSYMSTPSSSISLNDDTTPQDEEICFPSYDDHSYFELAKRPIEPANSPAPSATPPATPTKSINAPLPSSLYEPDQSAGDDMAIENGPTRHVDYLSYAWKEEDIWSSWRHIVARRKVYSNSSRLENASWRTWAKSKNRLKTIPPDTLNWMKDHDVTWLYGPLQTGKSDPMDPNTTPPAIHLSRIDSFASKKPILKRRSLSEVMLQRSLSSSTLMRQATDALRAQQPDKILHERPVFDKRTISDFTASSCSETPLTRATTYPGSSDPSTSSSGIQTPCTKRHIHFNDKVEQCIAINKDHEDHHCFFNTIKDDDDSDSSDDGLLIMRPAKETTKALIRSSSTPRDSFSSESKTIAMLPSTTLNYRGDTPEPDKQQAKENRSTWKKGKNLSPSPSQTTIRPSTPSTNFLLDDEDDDADMNWQPSAGRRGSIFPRGGLEMNADDEDDMSEGGGMRRTPSGMFMPYDDEDEYHRDGILGKVVDTVNTAKDIAHVIWNVGWRR